MKHRLTCKAENISSLTPYRKSLPTTEGDSEALY